MLRRLSEGTLEIEERRNIKTVSGDFCRQCVREKKIPDYIDSTPILKRFPKVEYIDTNGDAHVHNMDILVNSYKCSNEHEWVYNISMNRCWCSADKFPRFESEKLKYKVSRPSPRCQSSQN